MCWAGKRGGCEGVEGMGGAGSIVVMQKLAGGCREALGEVQGSPLAGEGSEPGGERGLRYGGWLASTGEFNVSACAATGTWGGVTAGAVPVGTVAVLTGSCEPLLVV